VKSKRVQSIKHFRASCYYQKHFRASCYYQYERTL